LSSSLLLHRLIQTRFPDASLLNQMAGQPFHLGRVTFNNFDGAEISGVYDLKPVIIRSPSTSVLISEETASE
jgi:hypothetical protein